MNESQFEKMCKALAKAERERDLSRHTVGVQDKIINELQDEVDRLRELIKNLHECGDISPSLWDRIKQEVGDE
jgi:hypothetical protein